MHDCILGAHLGRAALHTVPYPCPDLCLSNQKSEQRPTYNYTCTDPGQIFGRALLFSILYQLCIQVLWTKTMHLSSGEHIEAGSRDRGSNPNSPLLHIMHLLHMKSLECTGCHSSYVPMWQKHSKNYATLAFTAILGTDHNTDLLFIWHCDGYFFSKRQHPD